MKHQHIRSLILGVALAFLGTVSTQAAGLLHPAGDAQSPLDLKSHMVDVVVEDGYVVTHIEQVFANPSAQDLEAVYSFPVPQSAAVSGFVYWVDGKPISGEVVEKQRARALYERERDAGREAAITEQHDYRTFDISVTPVRASADVRIKLSYIQPAHVDLGIGRYVYPLAEGGVDEQKLAFWGTETDVQEYFRFGMWIRPSVPLSAVRLPSHPGAVVSQDADGSYRVVIESGTLSNAPNAGEDGPANVALEVNAGTKTSGQFGSGSAVQAPGAVFSIEQDIVVYWRLQDGLPGSVDLVANRPDASQPGTFMMTLTPGDELRPLSEVGSDWVFVVDVSGSMAGKLHSVQDGLRQVFGSMQPNDRAHVVTFDNTAQKLTPYFLPGTGENKERLKSLAGSIATGGGTNLFAGLEQGLNLADPDRSTAVILITDGVANAGETEHQEFIKLMERKDVRLFTFVMGNSANRPLLKSMTRASGGEAINVSTSDDIIGHVKAAVAKLHHEALRDIQVSIDGVGARGVTPLELGTLHTGEQLTLFGRYSKAGIADLKVTGKINGRVQTYETRIRFPEMATNNPEIDRLWYFSRIEELMEQVLHFGEDGERVGAIIDLAVEGGLVTPYTSMLVVRDDVFTAEGITRRNAARTKEEMTAQRVRASGSVTNQSAQVTPQPGTQQPYAGPRPSHSSGGSGGGNVGLLGLLLAWFTSRAARQAKRAGDA
ncbi:MAG: VIT and VWA domain-containing protein [Pseudomonadota bacterium]